MRSSRICGDIKAEALIIPHVLQELNSIYNCFIIFSKYFKFSLNACFISKKTQAANNGTAGNSSETLIRQSDYKKIFLKQLSVRLQDQSKAA